MVDLKDESKDKLTLRGKEVAVRRGLVEHSKLKFFVDNPRIYSVVRTEGQEPE